MTRLWGWVAAGATFFLGALLTIVGLGGWWRERQRDKARRAAELAITVAKEETRAAEAEALEGFRSDELATLKEVDRAAVAGDLNSALDALRSGPGSEPDPD